MSGKFYMTRRHHDVVIANRRRAIAALTTAGILWGTTVPLSKLALDWLAPGWLTAVRFGLAAVILLVVTGREGLRAACTPAILASGAIGYGGSVVVQNAGITRTSVSHGALLIGAVPVLVAIIAALWRQAVARPVAWAGFGVSLAGVGLITGTHGGGATIGGDGLVLASVLLSASFTVAQGRLLPGRDPVAVTAVQFVGAALAALLFSVTTEGLPAVPSGASAGPVLATAGLAACGTLLPFTLFAHGQSRVSAEVAGAFLNLEPLVGTAAGVVLFGDPAGPEQLAGGVAILGGIALSSLPLLRGPSAEPRPSVQASQRIQPAQPGQPAGQAVRGGLAGSAVYDGTDLGGLRNLDGYGQRQGNTAGACAISGDDRRLRRRRPARDAAQRLQQRAHPAVGGQRLPGRLVEAGLDRDAAARGRASRRLHVGQRGRLRRPGRPEGQLRRRPGEDQRLDGPGAGDRAA